MAKKTPKSESVNLDEKNGLCDGMNFTMAESYKMLRTKLNLIMPREEEGNESQCRVFGVTSSIPGEGKTVTSINLAYTYAESGKSVCLIEADMRLPNIDKRLHLDPVPGLSNVLAKQVSENRVLQFYKSPKGVRFAVITGGDIPPMPSELLESRRMKKLLETLRTIFEYIIVDLPPVDIVTDAITFSPLSDGMILVIRKDYCNKKILQDAMNQLKLANVHLAGVVFNGTDGTGTSSGGYKKNRYYSKYQYDKT